MGNWSTRHEKCFEEHESRIAAGEKLTVVAPTEELKITSH